MSASQPDQTERHPDHTRPARYWSGALGHAGQRSAQILLILLLVSVAVYGLMQITLVVIPVLLALILGAAIAPFVNWLRRKGWPSALATGLSFLLLLAVFGGLITGIVFAIRSEWSSLVDQAVQGFEKLYDFVENGPLPIDDNMLRSARDSAIDFATSSTVSNGALAGLSAATSFATGFLLMAVVLFYFLKDGDRIWAFFLRLFPDDRRDKARLSGFRVMEVLGGYIRGTAIVAMVDAVCIGAALFFLGVPLALPLTVIVFVGSFIPLVGATAAGVFAALIALVANGPVVALIVVIVIILVNQLEGNFLQPVVMGKSLSIHALVILLALTAGTILAGIIGAILAVPIAAVGWAVIKVWTGEDTGEDIEEAGEIPNPEDQPEMESAEKH
ncbi:MULTISPECIES: AI-2E family transporter [unclassified Arthrobacter]|uniref:AI-2E family transporter n=1 Tax=unclassified Arthrobacter TaxID=235627 RepID=UPI001D158BFD|nr:MULTISPECIES: AI-2E family transporter [unclassified Arthrobacter]MCC3276634.1 AI-2E family transporter [Arthrobacter sp. zg-Y20]MCC3279827.1 AI-2E family transporter [Arthrobacter sp. zg-Y40]MCC9178416.1 AI-2E family transporter [Arthrobacter sp. zg-Y750]MDK1316794.1 AI-2E family transporter [Arthrobacter sp. zg.Y20]MDK1328194.1 AI-2E family transporter [Arthrobacter sp. zg-Y1143]